MLLSGGDPSAGWQTGSAMIFFLSLSMVWRSCSDFTCLIPHWAPLAHISHFCHVKHNVVQCELMERMSEWCWPTTMQVETSYLILTLKPLGITWKISRLEHMPSWLAETAYVKISQLFGVGCYYQLVGNYVR